MITAFPAAAQPRKPRGRMPVAVSGLLLSLVVALPCWSQTLVRDTGTRSIEGAWTSITLTSDTAGLVEARCMDCPDVPTVLLTVDARSSILLDHEPITLSRAATISGGWYRGLSYDPDTMRLVVLSIISPQ